MPARFSTANAQNAAQASKSNQANQFTDGDCSKFRLTVQKGRCHKQDKINRTTAKSNP